MIEFRPRLWDDNAVTAYLRRYSDAVREADAARKRLERLEYLANKDKRYHTGAIQSAIDEDRQRLSNRIFTAENVKADVLAMLDLLPDGDERRALELYYVACMPVAEIAEVMHFSNRSIWNLKERGVKLIIAYYMGGCNARKKGSGDRAENEDSDEGKDESGGRAVGDR